MAEEQDFEVLKQTNEEQTLNLLISKYRHTLCSTEIGIDVLADIMVNLCHFGCELENADQVAQYNIGMHILARLGIVSKENRLNIIRALTSVMPAKKESEGV